MNSKQVPGRKTPTTEVAGKGRIAAAVEKLGGHGLGRCGGLGLAGGQLGGAVHVIERQTQSVLSGKIDQLLCHVRRQGLTTFVVTNIPLGAAEAVSHCLLRDAEVVAYGLEVVHAQIVAPLGCKVNSGDILSAQQCL